MALSLKRYAWRYDRDCALFRALAERDEREKEKSLGLATLTMEVLLPENVIIEILSWLPVKSLLCFKTVCKSWGNIIVSPYFISKHLSNYYNHNNDMDCFFTLREVTQAGEIQMCIALALADESPSLADESQSLADESPSLDVDLHKAPSLYADLRRAPLYNSDMCGPCNGIYYRSVFYNDKRGLWNPTTNDFKLLPQVVMKPDDHDPGTHLTYADSDRHFGYCDETFGFGQDPLTKDYKVVVIKRYWSTATGEYLSHHPPAVLVYSLRMDSWKYWGDLPERYYLAKNKSYIFVNGCVYWLGSREDNLWYSNVYLDVMISFNMANDALEKIQVPDYDKQADACLGIYRESIAIYTVAPRDEDVKNFEMWTLNQGIWTKKISIEDLDGIRRPIGHFKNDKVILLAEDYQSLVLCDPDTEEMWDITDAMLLGYGYVGVLPYMDSLVSVNGLSKHI